MQKIKNYEWNEKKLIGEGGFGKVYLGKDLTKKNTSKEVCVVKKMKYHDIFNDKTLLSLYQNEKKALLQIKSEFLVGARDIIEKSPYILVIMDYLDGGDLRKLLIQNEGMPIQENKAQKILIDIIKGFHRDLKPENIFIDNGVYKVGDFGFCEYIKNNQILDLICGSPGYICPEMILEKSYTEKCDIWSLGMIYYELLFQNIPYPGLSDLQRIKKILKFGIVFPESPRISKQSRTFLQQCLQVNEQDRWNWQLVFDSDIFNTQLEIKNQINQNIIDNKFNENIRLVQISKKETDFLKQMQQWIQEKGPNGVKIIFDQYFPQGYFNFFQFQKFCSFSEIKYTSLQNIFNYLDYQRDGQVTLEEFQYKILQTDLSQSEKDPNLIKRMCRAIIYKIYLQVQNEEIDLLKIYNSIPNKLDRGMDQNCFFQFINNIDKDITQYELELLFKEFDHNLDGFISKEEFIKVKFIIQTIQQYPKNDKILVIKKQEILNKSNQIDKKSSCFSCFQKKPRQQNYSIN